MARQGIEPRPRTNGQAPVEFRDMTRHQQFKLMGFFGVGAVFTIVGACLMGCAQLYAFPASYNVDTLGPAALREALHRDRAHDSLFSAGISFLTSGLLILLGFGLTELLANRHS
jgi:hypothetical protein